jgi:hypothetical protein
MRDRQQADCLPPIGAVDVRVTRHRRIRRPHPAGGCITKKARRAARHASQAWPGESFVTQTDFEMFYGIGNGACVELPDGVEGRA